ncbi:methyltransferase, TIGR00027 family [Sphingomonas sp. YR710]|jgi:methyltransferase (TIGR00027 family)|uniref:class I SAM-dependent methyltransferase n=1 Tax=Sphingomonas sp. YR710 TaxID=1882773 RepID=UPI00088968DD|nr:class I SAM-dependent methyltransferase [Sphingomonas sp. YR710]SDD06262.1 methyltransferase, TIGR00027 family [Sphingomonas sp. YR710]
MSSGSDGALSEVHRTAFMAAAMRAGHFLEGAEPKIFRDQFAPQLLEMSDDEIREFTAKVPLEMAASCVLRSRFTEDRLAAARGRLNQYVVLGAGLDSYALRMGDALESMIVFEVDDPPFQAWKKKRIEQLGLKTPGQVRYVPCDFERMSIDQALAAQGFAADEPCFISWLGVTQYLTREAIRTTLRWAGERPAGSEIVVTIVEPGAQEQRRARASDPVHFVSFISLEEMSDMLREAGFSRIEPLTQVAAREAYLKGRTDGLIIPEFQLSIAAIV